MVLFQLVACNYQLDKGGSRDSDPGAQNSPDNPETGAQIDFKTVQESVFLVRCQKCHSNSGEFTFEDHQTVLSHLDDIENRVFIERSMPPSGKITENEKATLKAWIHAGGPP